MKIALIVAALALCGCAQTMQVGNVKCEPYGFLNKENKECSQALYEVRPGNAAVALITLPFFPLGTVVSGYILGWRLYGPVKPTKQTVPPQQ